jgi:hypothetical protein
MLLAAKTQQLGPFGSALLGGFAAQRFRHMQQRLKAFGNKNAIDAAVVMPTSRA